MREEPLVVIDRRHSHNPQPAPVEEVKAEPVKSEVLEFKGNSRKWKTRAYMVTATQGPGGHPVFIGRGFAQREDGFEVICDYILPIFWHRDFDWMEAVDMQMQTFLGCKCSDAGPCDNHGTLMQKWGNDGMSRWQLEVNGKPPEPVELCMKAAQRRQSGIISSIR